MPIVRLILCWTAIALAVLWSILIACIAIPAFLIKTSWGAWVHRLWGQGWCLLLGIRIHFQGLERLPSHGVIAPNHESMFDIIVLACLPIHYRWISKEQVGRIPFIGWAMKAMGCFFVKRDRSGHDLNVMAEVEQALREGSTVVIFPEGTRSRSGELLPFKKGAFKTAIHAAVPLIPIAISGTRDIAPPGRLPERRGHDVLVRIGQPILPKPADTVDSLLPQFRSVMVALLEENRKERRSKNSVL